MIRTAADLLPGTDEAELGCLVATVELDIVGAVVFVPVDNYGFGWVRALGVVRRWRRRGIGTDLKLRVMDICTKAGANAVRSEVHIKNFKMRNLNAKLKIPSGPSPTEADHLLYAAPIVASPEDLASHSDGDCRGEEAGP